MCEITPQLAEFLQEPANKKMSRTEITRKIDAYIQDNNLQDVMNPTNIYPDKKLMTLLLSALPLKPSPKMITFEMLRDIISNHCLFPQYEEYYYMGSRKNRKNNNISTRHLHGLHNHNRISRNSQDFWVICAAFTILFIILPLIIIR